MTRHDDRTLERYLLGELRDDEAAALEDDYFADELLTERLEAVETDLLDAYARGQLVGARRSAFEKRYIAGGEIQDRVNAARMLAAPLPARSVKAGWSAPARRFLALAASIAVLTGTFLIVRQTGRDANISAPVLAPAREAALPAPSPKVVSLAVTLRDGLTRSAGQMQTVTVPAGTDVILFESAIAPIAAGATLRAEITTPEGTVVYRPQELKVDTDASSVLTQVPAIRLTTGDYILAISSTRGGRTQSLSEYAFRVIRP